MGNEGINTPPVSFGKYDLQNDGCESVEKPNEVITVFAIKVGDSNILKNACANCRDKANT